ncbi:MAG: helix-turn-helix transcriptional regulator [Alphaproteobacteria bacterium]|nr:helix-turn-helix transcriptional regulator [Alphaproteobacteria bacterium]
MKEMSKQFIGLRIQSIRRNQKITQSKLAEACEVSVEAISNIERGVNYPSFENLKNICRFLNCPLSDILDFTDNVSKKRLNMETRSITAIRQLSDSKLEVALRILEVL